MILAGNLTASLRQLSLTKSDLRIHFGLNNSISVNGHRRVSHMIKLVIMDRLFKDFPQISDRDLLSRRIGELTELLSMKDIEAEKRLGSVEHELEQCKLAFQASREQYEHMLAVRSEELRQLQVKLSQSEDEVVQQQSVVEQMTCKLNQLESYLARLPTADEYNTTMRQLQLTEHRAVELEQRSMQTQQDLENYERQLNEMAVKVKRSMERESLLQTQLDGAMQRLGFKSSDRPSDHITPEFVEDLKFDRDRYKASFEQTKKLLEAETHRAEAAEARQKADKRQFQEQVAREEATVAGLKATLSNRHLEIEQLKETISQLHAEKQDLTSNLLNTHTELVKANSLLKSTAGRKRLRLSRDLEEAVQDLQNLAEHMRRLAAGEKLDLASLLTQSLPMRHTFDFEALDNPPVETVTAEGAESPLSRNVHFAPSDGLMDSDFDALTCSVREARKIMAQLRQDLTDRYADHLGGRLDCLVQ